MTSRNGSLISIIEALFGSPMTGIKGVGLNPVPANAAFPYVTVQELVCREEENLLGRVGLTPTIHQISCWSPVYSAAFATRETIQNYLYTFKGTVGANKIAAVNADVNREFFDGVRSLHQVVCRLRIVWEF